MHKKKRICFVGMDNYPVLAKLTSKDYIGGESVQQTLLAKAFVALGFEVSMIVKKKSDNDEKVIDGVRVLAAYEERGGLPVLRFIHPRATGLLSALKRANADIYFQSCAGVATGIVAWHCQSNRRQFLFRLAHDSDCIPGQQLIRFWRDRKIYEYGLRRATHISAQGDAQVQLLRKYYSLPSTSVNMAVELPDAEADREGDIDVLWVNNLRDFKRPDLCVELAAALSPHRVVMIGGPVREYESLYERIKQEAGAVKNLKFLGAVPYAQVNEYFNRARVFVNTSDQEGFPNSFLQAWIRGVPVVSFFDPDGLIAEHGLGAVPKDSQEMVKILASFLSDNTILRNTGETCREFAMSRYAPLAVAQRYVNMLATPN